MEKTASPRRGGNSPGGGGYSVVESFDDATGDQPATDAELGILSVHLDDNIKPSVRSEEEVLSPAFWLKYFGGQLWGQAKIVTPLCAYIIGFKELALASRTQRLELIGLAVLATACGLTLFLEGLRFGVMPLSEALGHTLPRKAPLPVTLLIAGILGVGVTFAEPAIGALQAVGGDIDCAASPYLFVLLNGWSVYLVMAVGAGVGMAAVVGVLRFLEGWSLKPSECAALHTPP